ncbi:MAG: hypothetical protein KJ667_08045, partial [Alphaproteobacteria bacterium]|nr:hypothetical protein [Alphaproteobacteria bacterium]
MILTNFIQVGAGLLMLAGGAPSGHVQCPAVPTPAVKVNVTVAPPVFDDSRTIEQLSADFNQNEKGVSPGTSAGDSLTVLGLHRAKIDVVPLASIAGNQHKRRGFICLWYSEVGLDLKLSYTTYVARAGWSPACRAAIKAHEERHATVNREFAEQLGRELTASLNYAVKRRSMFG